MSINIVLCAMKEGERYLPEQVPCSLTESTIRSYLNKLWLGGLVEREKIEISGEEDGRKKKRIAYTSKQKALDL